MNFLNWNWSVRNSDSGLGSRFSLNSESLEEKKYCYNSATFRIIPFEQCGNLREKKKIEIYFH